MRGYSIDKIKKETFGIDKNGNIFFGNMAVRKLVEGVIVKEILAGKLNSSNNINLFTQDMKNEKEIQELVIYECI